MLDDFFGQLLPLRLGVIEQGHLEHPQSAPIQIQFIAGLSISYHLGPVVVPPVQFAASKAAPVCLP